MSLFVFLYRAQMLNAVVGIIERQYIKEEKQYHAEGIEEGTAVYQIVEYVIGGTVAAHQEHIIIG